MFLFHFKGCNISCSRLVKLCRIIARVVGGIPYCCPFCRFAYGYCYHVAINSNLRFCHTEHIEVLCNLVTIETSLLVGNSTHLDVVCQCKRRSITGAISHRLCSVKRVKDDGIRVAVCKSYDMRFFVIIYRWLFKAQGVNVIIKVGVLTFYPLVALGFDMYPSGSCELHRGRVDLPLFVFGLPRRIVQLPVDARGRHTRHLGCFGRDGEHEIFVEARCGSSYLQVVLTELCDE